MSAGTSPRTPEGALRAFAASLAAGGVRAALGHFTEDACLLTPDATVLYGRAAIAPVLEQMVAMRLRVFPTVERVLPVGDLALAQGGWRGLSAGPGGEPLEQRWRANVVLRQEGPRWRMHIVSPWEGVR